MVIFNKGVSKLCSGSPKRALKLSNKLLNEGHSESLRRSFIFHGLTYINSTARNNYDKVMEMENRDVVVLRNGAAVDLKHVMKTVIFKYK